MNKVEYSIDLIKKAEKVALKMNPDGFHLAFSGGKDSQCIYHLAKMAGVRFNAVMSITTLDPPKLLKFIRNNYPDVIFERPKINFYKLIVEKGMLPTKQGRYCCQYLKEQSGVGSVVITGIRKSESNKRARRNEMEKFGYSNTLDQFNVDVESKVTCINGKDKIILNPIIHWKDNDVWRFIRDNHIDYCSLYDNGYHRIGCVFCPMSTRRHKQRDRKLYPGIERQIKKSIVKLMDKGVYSNFNDADDVFNWWVSTLSVSEYEGNKLQTKLDL